MQSTGEVNIRIRRGEAKDVPGMMRLVRELAEFEKAPHEVVNTEQQLHEDGFGANPIYKAFVAEENDTIVGMAVYYTAYSTWKGRIFFLDDLIVTESKRRYGLGEKLIRHVLQDALDNGVAQIRWQVLDWNTPAITFYKKIGAELDDEWITCKMTNAQMSEYLKAVSSLTNQ